MGFAYFVHFFLHFHPQPEELDRQPIYASDLIRPANEVNLSPERIEQLIREFPISDTEDSSSEEVDSADSSYQDSGDNLDFFFEGLFTGVNV